MLRKLNYPPLLAIFVLFGLLTLGGCGGEEEPPQEGPPDQGEDTYDSTGGGSA